MLKIPVVCYSRVSGYYADVSQFNRGKKSELKQRKMLKIPPVVDKECAECVNAQCG